MPNHLAAALRVLLIGSLAILSGCGYAGTPPTDTSGAKAPAISQQPVNQSVAVGQSATFTVSATGAAPLAYQWFTNGTATSGANASTYTLPQVTKTQDQSAFYVIVSNSKGSVTSATAKLTVTSAAAAPEITAQPANTTVAPGQSATFL